VNQQKSLVGPPVDVTKLNFAIDQRALSIAIITNHVTRRMASLRVLVIDEEIPYPLNTGKRIRTWNLLKRLAKRHEIRLLCYGSPNDPAVPAVEDAGIKLFLIRPQERYRGLRLYTSLFINLFSPYPFSVTKHVSSRFQYRLNELLHREAWDLIHCEWTPYARFLSRVTAVPVLVATHNVEAEIWARRAEHTRHRLGKLFFHTQELKMRWFERRALLRASAVTAVTNKDAETMRSWGVKQVRLVPNGVDPESYSGGCLAERENEILFLGSLDWYPNIDALNYFIDNILPLVRLQHSQARLRVVGRRPSEALRKRCQQCPAIDFVGEVPDVRSYLQRAAMVVVPLRIGAGSRIKILEALAAEKAVVSTSTGAAGLDVVSGRHLVIADSPSEFAARVNELLASDEDRRRLSIAGRMLVNSRYGWDEIAGQLECAWHALARTEVCQRPVCAAEVS
jgi:polysaccharide biosynthesis protein PslH